MKFIDELIEIFGGNEAPEGPWLKPEMQEAYMATGYTKPLKLSAEASKFLLDSHRGRNSKEATYILVDPDGDISRQKAVENTWPRAVARALDLNAMIYNPRSKRCTRLAWANNGRPRTLRNLMYEPVWCIVDPKVLDKLPTDRSKLFDTK